MRTNICIKLKEKTISDILSEKNLRKQNLLTIKSFLEKDMPIGFEKFLMLRITYPEIYANFEGFYKTCFINTLKLAQSMCENGFKLKNNYLIFKLALTWDNETFKLPSKSSKLLRTYNSTNEFSDSYIDRMVLDKYAIGYDGMESTLNLFGIVNSIDFTRLKAVYGRRNRIAHGSLEEGEYAMFRRSDVGDERSVNLAIQYWTQDCDFILESIESLSNCIVDYINKGEFII